MKKAAALAALALGLTLAAAPAQASTGWPPRKVHHVVVHPNSTGWPPHKVLARDTQWGG